MDTNSIGNLALSRSDRFGADYSYTKAPSSPLASLSGNVAPGETKVSWLRNRNKCNQFVGDVLTLSGYEMPTFRMIDGSEHYMNAEALPGQDRYFNLVSEIGSIRAGDVLVVDSLSKRGENGAHTEIVTKVDHDRGQMRTTGARKSGAAERDFSKVFAGLSPSEAEGSFKHPFEHANVFFLRPIKRRTK
jgi:hypothetical protein